MKTQRIDGLRAPLQEGSAKLMIQILLPGAESSIKDALTIFHSIKKEVYKQ